PQGPKSSRRYRRLGPKASASHISVNSQAAGVRASLVQTGNGRVNALIAPRITLVFPARHVRLRGIARPRVDERFLASLACQLAITALLEPCGQTADYHSCDYSGE